MEYDKLLEKIKEKKELKGLEDKFVKNVLDVFLKKNNISLSNLKEKEVKLIVKSIRADLRKSTGRFQKSSNNRLNLLNENKINELLLTHASTKERISIYPKIRDLIKELNVRSILDLGSGINPIALANKNITYYATDIKADEIELINIYFKKNKISGKAYYYNLKEIDESLPKVDLCLILKVFDVLEVNSHKLAEKIITSVNTKYFLISFPTKTLSGKPMNHPQRGWIERLLTRIGFSYKILNENNEIFYLAKKS